MENYNNASDFALDLSFNFIKGRMKELKISQKKLSTLIEVDESTLIRNFKKDTEMSLRTYFKICGALKLRPYLIPAENDDTKMHRTHFN